VQVIARVPGLMLLNGSTVDARERRDCELHYLRGLLAQAEERPAQLQVPPPHYRNCVHGRAWGPRHHRPLEHVGAFALQGLRFVLLQLGRSRVHVRCSAALPTS
jgi:hypothetical protein